MWWFYAIYKCFDQRYKEYEDNITPNINRQENNLTTTTRIQNINNINLDTRIQNINMNRVMLYHNYNRINRDKLYRDRINRDMLYHNRMNRDMLYRDRMNRDTRIDNMHRMNRGTISHDNAVFVGADDNLSFIPDQRYTNETISPQDERNTNQTAPSSYRHSNEPLALCSELVLPV